MSYQDPNQPYGAPQQGQGQSGGWAQQQGSWGQPGGIPQPQSSAPQQNSGQGSWGAHPGQFPMPPQQPNHGAAPGYGQQGQPGPQDYSAQQFYQQQPGYGQGYPGGPQGYMPQTDFGSGAGYGPGYPMPNQGNSGLATISLWLGILGGWGLINLVISILALRETGPGKKPGRNKAITGLILTVAWAVVWIGVFVAVSAHANNQPQPVSAPTAPAVATTAGSGATGSATAASGSGSTSVLPQTGGTASTANAYLTGATDPGCLGVQVTFNSMAADPAATSGYSDFITSLQLGASESTVASSQISALYADFTTSGTSESRIGTDFGAMEAACGMTATATDPD